MRRSGSSTNMESCPSRTWCSPVTGASGDLHDVPAIIVTGRNDAIIAPTHASRAYFGLNQLVEGKRSRLHYYEVTNAQHLDALNTLPDYAKAYVPLHHYFIQALVLMYDH